MMLRGVLPKYLPGWWLSWASRRRLPVLVAAAGAMVGGAIPATRACGPIILRLNRQVAAVVAAAAVTTNRDPRAVVVAPAGAVAGAAVAAGVVAAVAVAAAVTSPRSNDRRGVP